MNKEDIKKHIPKSFTINGKEYKVEIKDQCLLAVPGEEKQTDLGTTYFYSNPRIELATKVSEFEGEINPEVLVDTYYHELFHVLINEIHLLIDDDQTLELIVENLSNAYYQYILSAKYE